MKEEIEQNIERVERIKEEVQRVFEIDSKNATIIKRIQ